ncbi:hypothetical protein D4764_03G0012430, partial [Takifugu flavidus]
GDQGVLGMLGTILKVVPINLKIPTFCGAKS